MKNFILASGLLLIGFGVQAQENYRSLSAGVKAGANYSNAVNESKMAGESVYGPNGGIVVNYKYTKKHAFQTEFVYSEKGFVQTDIDVKNTLRYLEIPLLYQRTFYCCKKGGNIVERKRSGHFYLFGGPQLSILLTSTAQFQSNEVIPEGNSKTVDLYPYTRPFDISAVAGIGYKFKKGISIDMRYAQSLRHLHGSPHALIPAQAYNSALQMGVSYLFPVNLK